LENETFSRETLTMQSKAEEAEKREKEESGNTPNKDDQRNEC